MRITCPSCAAQYEVDAEDISPTGQEFQCSDCLNIWEQSRDGSVSEITPEEVVGDTVDVEEGTIVEDVTPVFEIEEPEEEASEEAVIIDFPEVAIQEPVVDLPTDITESEAAIETFEDEIDDIVDESTILEEIIADTETEEPEIDEPSVEVDIDPEDETDVISNLDDIEIAAETPSDFTYTPVFDEDPEPISLRLDTNQDTSTSEEVQDDDIQAVDDLDTGMETPELADMPFMAPPIADDLSPEDIEVSVEVEEFTELETAPEDIRDLKELDGAAEPDEEPVMSYYKESTDTNDDGIDDTAEIPDPEELEAIEIVEEPTVFDDPFETIIITEDDIIVADEPESSEEADPEEESFAEEINETIEHVSEPFEEAPLVEENDSEEENEDLESPEPVVADELVEDEIDEIIETVEEEAPSIFPPIQDVIPAVLPPSEDEDEAEEELRPWLTPTSGGDAETTPQDVNIESVEAPSIESVTMKVEEADPAETETDQDSVVSGIDGLANFFLEQEAASNIATNEDSSEAVDNVFPIKESSLAETIRAQVAVEDALDEVPEVEDDVDLMPDILIGQRARVPNLDALKDSVRDRNVKPTREVKGAKSDRGFIAGLVLTLLVFALLFAIYMLGDTIIAAVPVLAPVLEIYVNIADTFRGLFSF